MERHPKLAPLSTMTEGVFIAGACQGPKDIPDSGHRDRRGRRGPDHRRQGPAGAGSGDGYRNPTACSGCHNCVTVCPYGAPVFNTEKNVSEINEALCKGCGLCAAGCPSSAIYTRHFTNDQVMAEIEGLMEF